MRAFDIRFATPLSLLLILALAACSDNGGSGPADSPDAAFSSSIQSLRNNDVAAFLAATMPQSLIDEIQSDYESGRDEPVEEADAQRFVEMMERLTAPGAEQKLADEIKPQLAQNAAQLPFVIGMARGMAQSSLQQSEDLDDEQKVQARQVLSSVADWAESADLTNPDKLDQAIAVVCQAARDMDLSSLDEARVMSFDSALGKAGNVLGATKEILSVYGLSVNDMLDSVETKTVESDDGTATLEVAYKLFGQAQSTSVKMAKAGDYWYSQGVVDRTEDTAL